MLLDKLLANIAVKVNPFAMCLLSTGWRLSLPGPPDVLLHFVLQGSGVLRGPNGQAHRISSSWLGIVPKGVEHALECGSEVQRTRVIDRPPPPGAGVVRLAAGSSEERADLQVACGVVRVTYGDSLGLFQWLKDVVVVDLSEVPQVRGAFESILAEQGGASPGNVFLTEALMSQCLVYSLRRLSEQSDHPLVWLSALRDTDLSQAVDLVLEHPDAAHSVASLADAASMSRSAFAERFRAAFGCTPMTFVHDVRLRKGAELLRQRRDLSIDQIARRVGFSSRSHFSQAFKEHFAETPVTFRQGSWSELSLNSPRPT